MRMAQNEYKKMLKRQKRHSDALEGKKMARIDENDKLVRVYSMFYYAMITFGVTFIGSIVIILWARLGLNKLIISGILLALFVASDVAKNKTAKKYHTKK